MSEPDILYPAIFVFSMMLIGLLLTSWEFSQEGQVGNSQKGCPGC